MTRTEAVSRAKAWFDSATVTRALKIVAMVSLLASLTVGLKQAELTACLADWNDANNRISAARSAANQADREALDTMVDAIAKARHQPGAVATAAVDDALLAYLRSRAFADGERAANPIPGPPSAVC